MCDLCNQNDGEMVSCPDCGVMICFDVKNGDDIIKPAATTSSCDLACIDCARRQDRQEEEADEDYWRPDYNDCVGDECGGEA